jgi:hypothetical protein
MVRLVQRLVFGKAFLQVAIAVAPGPEFFDNPCSQPGRRIIKPVGERLRFSRMHHGICTFLSPEVLISATNFFSSSEGSRGGETLAEDLRRLGDDRL